MSTSFPTGLQDLDATRGANTDPLSAPNHVDHHTLEDQTSEAIQQKVGIDNSADTTSIDYKLKNTSSLNPGHKHTLANGASDVTASPTELNYSVGVTSLIQPQITAKTDKSTLTTKGDIYVATGASTLVRLPVGSDNQVLSADSAQTTGLKWSATIAVTDIQTFPTAGTNTWTKPSGARKVEVHMFGAGGGGGGGGFEGAANGKGAGGGGGGSYAKKDFTASGLGATESVVTGAGGTAGTGKATGSDGNGTAGGNGGASSFGTTAYFKAPGGTGGATTTSTGDVAGLGGAGGVIGNGLVTQAGGAGGNGASQGVDTSSDISPRGGGGGGVSNSNNAAVGGAFITNYVQAGGAVGTVGNSNVAGLIQGGTGGGGGNHGAGTGGNGGTPGAGAGGGAGGTGVTPGTNGGVGADGLVVVITYF